MQDHIKTGDAEQAYAQMLLKGDEAWVMLPEKFWDPKWRQLGVPRPVVCLVKALYGHPNAGAYWEERCNAILTDKLGWKPARNQSSLF